MIRHCPPAVTLPRAAARATHCTLSNINDIYTNLPLDRLRGCARHHRAVRAGRARRGESQMSATGGDKREKDPPPPVPKEEGVRGDRGDFFSRATRVPVPKKAGFLVRFDGGALCDRPRDHLSRPA